MSIPVLFFVSQANQAAPVRGVLRSGDMGWCTRPELLESGWFLKRLMAYLLSVVDLVFSELADVGSWGRYRFGAGCCSLAFRTLCVANFGVIFQGTRLARGPLAWGSLPIDPRDLAARPWPSKFGEGGCLFDDCWRRLLGAWPTAINVEFVPGCFEPGAGFGNFCDSFMQVLYRLSGYQ